MLDPLTIINFLLTYRLHIVVIMFSLWGLYAVKRLKLRWRRLVGVPRRFPTPVPTEQRLATAETERRKLQDKVEKLELTLAKMKSEEISRQIREKAEDKVAALIPNKQFLLHPDMDITGRPIYYVGGVPTIDIEAETERIATRLKFPFLKPILRRLYFGDSHTLHWWNVRLMPNGRWGLIAISKTPRRRRDTFILPRFAKKYIIYPSMQKSIENLILNRYEVINQGAAVELAATIIGPFPIEKWLTLTAPFKERIKYEKEEKESKPRPKAA